MLKCIEKLKSYILSLPPRFRKCFVACVCVVVLFIATWCAVGCTSFRVKVDKLEGAEVAINGEDTETENTN